MLIIIIQQNKIYRMLQNLKTKVEGYFPKRQRKCIQNWDFIFVFEQYYKAQIQLMFSNLKCQQHIQWTVVDNQMQKQALFLVRISDKIVKEMAHQLKILKIKNKLSFQMKLKQINLLIYSTDKVANPNIYNYLCFLRARMRPKNKQIYQQQKYSPFNKNKEEKFVLTNGKLFTPQEQLRAKYHFLLTYTQKNLIKQGQLSINDTNKQPLVTIMRHPGFSQLVPVQKVSQHRFLILGPLKQYVGPNSECYFEFVSFMQKWLIFPMIIGLLTILFNYMYDFNADNSPFDFIYALVIMIWSILFITRWEQIQKWTKLKETCGRSQIWTQSQNLTSKDLYQKYESKVTGKIQTAMPFRTRILLTIASNFVCYAMMLITLVFIVYSLNARGFIDPEHKLFYSEFVSSLAQPGGIFDSNTMLGQIPNIIHVLVTNGFDENVYRPIAKKLAKIQRHQSRKGYQNSIILKYFIYEFVITFADLFYIAFVRLDIEGLRQQLLSLFFIDIVRRVIAESVVPWIKHKKHRHDSLKYLKTSSLSKNQSYQSNLMSQEEELQWGAILQVNKENYEPFDDYLQIITNVGYLVMISSCFPLAPLLILIAHQVQLIQDKYKIIHIFKRKLPECYVGMGRWKDIIVFLCYISIVTNIMLFAFSSQQVVSYFPKMYQSGKDLLYGNTDISTIIGDAAGIASNLFQNLLKMENITVDGSIADMFNNQTFLPLQISQSAAIHNAHPVPFVVKQFKPPKKQSQLTFMAILFFIEHFFLLLFIFLRDALKKKKSEAEIFVERREYKRRIKKNLPKDILIQLKTTYLVTKLINQQININPISVQQQKSKNESLTSRSTNITQNQQISGNIMGQSSKLQSQRPKND